MMMTGSRGDGSDDPNPEDILVPPSVLTSEPIDETKAMRSFID
jgi:hypothetical protein